MLVVHTAPPQPVLTWGDVKAIIGAVRLKVYHDGYREWIAAVHRNQDGLQLGHVELIEEVHDGFVSN